MANMELITSVTVGSGGAASVTLPATGTIPATYTDLQVLMSVRTAGSGVGDTVRVQFNGSSSNFTTRIVYGDGSTAASTARGDGYVGYMNAGGSTSNTFSSASLYIPNYTSSNYKSYSVDKVSEQNATEAYPELVAGLWSNTAAITSLTFVSAGSFNIVEGSTFYLYGISNVTSTTKATGGIVSSDGTYWYHMFPYSGTFTPTTNLTADYLVIAGGGGGGSSTHGAGGGAGGYKLLSSQSLTTTGYTVIVGGGGAGGLGGSGGGTGNYRGANGVDSSFNSVTSTGGGGGGTENAVGLAGGSGGGGSPFTGGTGGAGGAASPSGQGNAGGAGSNNLAPNYGAGGGGGAGTAGGVGLSTSGGAGGIGNAPGSTWSLTTQTGVNGYYAAGGGGSSYSATGGAGGLGGGGQGANANGASGVSGITNTGSGGGGGERVGTSNGGNGGSGLVIIRYAI